MYVSAYDEERRVQDLPYGASRIRSIYGGNQGKQRKDRVLVFARSQDVLPIHDNKVG